MSRIVFALLAVYFTLGCSGYDGSQPVSFATLAQGTALRPPKIGSSQPLLVVITSLQEAEAFIQSDLLSNTSQLTGSQDKVAEQLRNLDYSQSIAVFVFQGTKSSSGYSVAIQNVRLKENDVSIYATFKRPQQNGLFGSEVVQPLSSDPYQLISIPRQLIHGKTFRFALVVDDAVLRQVSHEIS